MAIRRSACAGIALAAAGVMWLGAQSERTPVTKTPPMGWNSWDSYGLSVTESEFKENAGYLARTLRPHGWEYAVVDEGWYLQNPAGKAGGFHFTMDSSGRYLPAQNRFASAAGGGGFQKLAAWVHGQNLKFGIHIIRGIPREAVEKNLAIAGSRLRAGEAASRSDICAWNADNYGVKANAAGQAYYDSIAALYAGWGVDFVKIDCISYPYRDDEIRMFSAALQKTGRPIVLSLSPGPTPIEKAADVRKHADLWRISGDVWDHWRQEPKQEWTQGLLGQFRLAANWARYVTAGHWPDADMLPLGYLGPRPGHGKARQTAFSGDEARTLLTLWSIFRSPLFMGGNLTKTDAATAALLTNDEALAVDQRATGGHAVLDDGKKAVWVAKAADSGKSAYVALFNLADEKQKVTYPLQSLGLSSTSFRVRDLWDRKDLGQKDVLAVDLRPHTSMLLRVTETK